MSDDLGDNLSKGNDDCSAKGREGEETNETLQDKPFLEDEDIVSPENETTTLGDNTGPRAPTKLFKKTRYTLLTLLCGILLTNSVGFLMGLGVFFVEIIDTFQESRAQTSLIQSVCLTVMYASGTLGSVLLSRFGVLKTGLFSAVVGPVGCIAASLAPSVPVLIFCVGVITGLSIGLMYIVAFSVMAQTIHDGKVKRLLITIATLGGTFGAFIYPYFGSTLIAEFGWRGTFLILGGILLNNCPIVMALTLLISRIQPVVVKRENETFLKTLNLSLFRKKAFLAACFNKIIISSFIFALNIFIVDIARSKGFDSQTGAFFLSIFGLAMIAGSIICILMLLFFTKTSSLTLYLFYVFAGGLTMIPIAHAQTYLFMLVAMVMYGLPWGAGFLIYSPVLLEMVGSDRYTSAIGYVNTLTAAGNLIAGPFGGALRDLTGTYETYIYVTMSLTLASGIGLFLIWCGKRRNKRSSKTLA